MDFDPDLFAELVENVKSLMDYTKIKYGLDFTLFLDRKRGGVASGTGRCLLCSCSCRGRSQENATSHGSGCHDDEEEMQDPFQKFFVKEEQDDFPDDEEERLADAINGTGEEEMAFWQGEGQEETSTAYASGSFISPPARKKVRKIGCTKSKIKERKSDGMAANADGTPTTSQTRTNGRVKITGLKEWSDEVVTVTPELFVFPTSGEMYWVVYQGFLFSHHRTIGNKHHYRCRKRNSTGLGECSSRIRLSLDYTEVTEKIGEHNHEADLASTWARYVVWKLKNQAVQFPEEEESNVLAGVLGELSEGVKACLPKEANLLKIVRDVRKESASSAIQTDS